MTTEQLNLIKSTLDLELKAIEHKENTIRLIQRAIEKKQVISTMPFYNIFGGHNEQMQDLGNIDAVINRLMNYLRKLN